MTVSFIRDGASEYRRFAEQAIHDNLFQDDIDPPLIQTMLLS